MLRRWFGGADELSRIRYAYGFAVAAALVFGGYSIVSGACAVGRAWTAERVLEKHRTQSSSLSAEAKRLGNRDSRPLTPASTGVERFAVQMDAWANAHRVRMVSLTPEGTEESEVVVFEKTRVGRWASDRVNVRGQGQFEEVMDVLEEFSRRPAPLRLESFSLRSVDSGVTGTVEFNITVTVYRKSGET